MQSMLIPKPSDDPHDVVVVAPDAVGVAPSDEEISDLLHQAARARLDPPTRTAPDTPANPAVPPVDTTFRAAAVDDVRVPGHRGSMGRAFIALLLAGCIGVAAFAWRSWGDTAEKKIAKWATQFVMTAALPPENPAPAAPPESSAVPADAANAAPPLPAASAQGAPAAAAPSVDSAQLLQSMARDLASLGQEVEQLKASIAQLKTSQQQISRDAAKVSETTAAETRASGQSPRPRTAAAPPRPPVAHARKPTPPLPSTQAAAPPLPQAGAPYYAPRQPEYAPRQVEPPPQGTAEPLTDPELATVPRPPMPLR